ncbi:restriction endonuclease [Nocardia takedensis]
MARRRGLFSELQSRLREADRARQREEALQQRQILWAQREQARVERVAERTGQQAQRQQRVRYTEQRRAQATWRTEGVQLRIEELSGLLPRHARAARVLSVEGLRTVFVERPYVPPVHLSMTAARPVWGQFAPPEATGWGGRFLRGREQELDAARGRFAQATEAYEQQMQARERALAMDAAAHERREDARRHEISLLNAELDDLGNALSAGVPETVEQVMRMFLTATQLPDDIPSDTDVAYLPHVRRLLVIRRLPDVTVIPVEREFRYVVAGDEIRPVVRKPPEVRQRYADLIAQLVLLTVHDAFSVQPSGLLDEVVIDAVVAGKSSATGQPEDQCLISVSVTREQFAEFVLTDLDPVACLRHLNALVSPHPWDFEPVRPLFELDLSKYKIDPANAASGIDHRTVLTDMRPVEFERLIRELFEAIGLEAWVTQESRDDGIDAVVVNRDPVVGGDCIVQAKRYRNIVGVEAVRALAGTIEDKHATRGILVTTSYFGQASRDFATRHGRIQLIEGPELKHLITRHLGKNVVIGQIKNPPKHWTP